MTEQVTAEEMEKAADVNQHQFGNPTTAILLRAGAAAIRDRDAGWQAAERLAEAVDELLYAISQWRQGGMSAEGCRIAEIGASRAIATYIAARAGRGNADEGQQVVGVAYNPNPEGRT